MNLIMASTSKVYGYDYLAYLKEPLKELFTNAKEILFIPFARPGGMTHQEYTDKAKEGLSFLNKKVVGLHEKSDKKKAVQEAEAIFTGGGNTFLLVKKLYEFELIRALKTAVLSGTPYLGTSAGSNICGLTMSTTNDMPIVYPPSFKTMGLIPFNVNVHYLDPEPNSKHQGE
ncbi:MAG TPA: dipeptidase PepE, partial [Flavobacteriaceae bacterium]|nr:dipeptidase PepE [Flavobacteriaceae bacterium]